MLKIAADEGEERCSGFLFLCTAQPHHSRQGTLAVTTFPEALNDKILVHRAVEAAIRIGLVALLVAWCFQIVRPFIVPFVWGIIIAVAVHPGYRRLEAALGNRRTIAATLFTLLMLILLIGPTVMLAGTLVESAQGFAADLIDGTLSIPAPPVSVAAGRSSANRWSGSGVLPP
jgi:uncharacterized membrane protein